MCAFKLKNLVNDFVFKTSLVLRYQYLKMFFTLHWAALGEQLLG